MKQASSNKWKKQNEENIHINVKWEVQIHLPMLQINHYFYKTQNPINIHDIKMLLHDLFICIMYDFCMSNAFVFVA